MQFWKILKKLIDDMLPDWRDEFLCYKDLKKQLKRIYSSSNKRTAGDRVKLVADAKEVVAFVELCHRQIVKLNNFVLDKQEWYLIRIEVLEGNLVAAKESDQELREVGRDLADLHGEIILLLNYITLNYTGLVKILKKHDKLSGELVRVPFIQQVLNEPFYKTDVLNNLVKKCEIMLAQIPSVKEQRLSSTRMENRYMKLTLLALEIWKEIRSGSSTVSMFSLPPIEQSVEMEDVWEKIQEDAK